MITKDNNLKVMELFFKFPEMKFHLREMERITGLSLPGIKKILSKLQKEGLLLTKKENVVQNFYASRNEKFIALKRCYNIYSLYNSGLLEAIKNTYEEPEAIVLFGSYSRGDDISKSDIDISIVTTSKKTVNFSSFEKKLDRKINLYEIILKKAEPDFINSLANGVVLYGYLKAV